MRRLLLVAVALLFTAGLETLSLAPKPADSERCYKAGQGFETGSTFMDPVNPCLTCECLQGGRYACTSVKCPAVNCPFDQQVRTVDGCCMECILQNSG